jgi:hypothetical protein
MATMTPMIPPWADMVVIVPDGARPSLGRGATQSIRTRDARHRGADGTIGILAQYGDPEDIMPGVHTHSTTFAGQIAPRPWGVRTTRHGELVAPTIFECLLLATGVTTSTGTRDKVTYADATHSNLDVAVGWFLPPENMDAIAAMTRLGLAIEESRHEFPDRSGITARSEGPAPPAIADIDAGFIFAPIGTLGTKRSASLGATATVDERQTAGFNARVAFRATAGEEECNEFPQHLRARLARVSQP